jgi:hypothetical protein
MIIARALVWEADLVLPDDLFAVLSNVALAKSEVLTKAEGGREETAGTESGSCRKAFGE